MDTDKLCQIINESTTIYRKGSAIEESPGVVQYFGYDHTGTAPAGDNYDKVDMVFVDVVVDRAKAEQYKGTLAELLRAYPQPERLAGGPSYIELAPNLGLEQEGALRVMALGKTLGMWEIISGSTMGFGREETMRLAGSGFLMISGYRPLE